MNLARRHRLLAALALTVAAVGLSTSAAPSSAQAPCTPALVDDFFSIEFDTALSEPAPGVGGNDTLCGQYPYVVQTTQHGVLTLYGDGGVFYVPDAGFIGTDTFVYSAGYLSGAQPRFSPRGAITLPYLALAEIEVGSECDVELEDDIYAGTTDTPLVVAAPGVSGNDVNCPEYPISIIDSPDHGTITSFAGDGSFTYVPDAGYEGPDNFTYGATYQVGTGKAGRSPRAIIDPEAQVNLRINAAPTTTTTAVPTTTTEPQIFENPTTTTTTGATTTTEVGETTTIVDEPTTTEGEPGTTTPTPSTSGDVSGDGTDRPAGTGGSGLARTGSGLAPIGLAGVALLGVGITLAAGARKRRAEQA